MHHASASSHPSVPLTFSLPSALTIKTVEALAAELKTAAAEQGALTLDASAVALVTTPGVQLLLSLAKQYSGADSAVHLINPPSPLAQAFTQLGLFSLLSSWGESHD